MLSVVIPLQKSTCTLYQARLFKERRSLSGGDLTPRESQKLAYGGVHSTPHMTARTCPVSEVLRRQIRSQS
jgi:hypothetical protein